MASRGVKLASQINGGAASAAEMSKPSPGLRNQAFALTRDEGMSTLNGGQWKLGRVCEGSPSVLRLWRVSHARTLWRREG